MKKESE
jgi:hypothetical protein